MNTSNHVLQHLITRFYINMFRTIHNSHHCNNQLQRKLHYVTVNTEQLSLCVYCDSTNMKNS